MATISQTPGMNGPLSRKLFSTAKSLIPGGVNSPVRAFRNVDGEPFFVRRAKGSRITDVDGKTYIDYVGSWGPNILGHAPIPVTNAIHEAAKDGVSFGIPNPQELEMAQLITNWVPSVEKVRMVNSGTEATMSCVRLARGFTGRDKIVKFEGCYHGHVDSLLVAAGSGALTFGEPDSAGVPKSFAAETIALPYNDAERLEETFAQLGDRIAGVGMDEASVGGDDKGLMDQSMGAHELAHPRGGQGRGGEALAQLACACLDEIADLAVELPEALFGEGACLLAQADLSLLDEEGAEPAHGEYRQCDQYN